MQEKIDATLGRQRPRFRAGRSCVDHMLRIILEQVNDFQESLYLVFIDYEKVMDRLTHKHLWGVFDPIRVVADVSGKDVDYFSDIKEVDRNWTWAQTDQDGNFWNSLVKGGDL